VIRYPGCVWRALLCLGFTACGAAEPNVSQIVGPDGTRAYYVSCAGSEARCFQLAGESCPLGYDYAATPRGNLLVRCKDLMAPSPYAAFSEHAHPVLGENPFLDAGLAPNPYTSATPTPSPQPAGSASFPPLK
jgi:hypothetical protein